ncbi:protein NODULATION SIGNALING PATHWAY 1-like [Bidens hawaiensis]|uniref:protein NODULATION SIGNALING PATHWAY 1-like n=1 Tax=Bidens hawaiensis TaxID=980011 RepID=UPI004049487A
MIKQGSLFLPSCPLNTTPVSETMMFREPEPDINSGQILDWLEDSMPHLPLILDDLYCPTDIMDDPWWGLDLDPIDDYIISNSNSVESSTVDSTTNSTTNVPVVMTDQPGQLTSLSKKRKAPEDQMVRKPSANKKGTGKSSKDNSNVGYNKDGRWAEQLLNPCVAAIAAGNETRVQHLLLVLQELASPTGDANYRLAAHGMEALLRHISTTTNRPAKAVGPTTTFATSSPTFFKRSLINFNDINPWFTVPNNIANNAILQVLSEHDYTSCKTLHILDIGVSHGFQWPTLLESLGRRPGGPPPLVRLTVVPPTHENHHIPFANCPPDYDFTSNILRFAKDVNVNLQINRLDNYPLQNLNSHVINSSPDETLIICGQFRLHSLNHTTPDNRTEFLKLMRTMNPKGVIITDNNIDYSWNSCNSFDSSFSQSLDYLWSFLDSASVAFKGKETDERTLIECEAAKALINPCEMNEKKDKWGERMTSIGFVEHAFKEDVVDQARALLKKYDSHWEMKVDDYGSVGLWWKGQPVSFCSLWKLD